VTNQVPDDNVWRAPTSAPPGAPVYGVPFGIPSGPSSRPSPPREGLASTGDVVTAIVAAAVMPVAGVPMGLLWGATARHVNITDLLQNNSEVALEVQPANDARFALLAIIFGLVAGVLAGWRGRRGGWPLPVGLLLGGLGGSLVAAQTGHLLASGSALSAIPPTARSLVRSLVDVHVRANGVHVLYPFAALLVYLLIVLVTTRAEPLTVSPTPSPGAWWSAPR
jgi:hypothetical protein